MPGLLFLPIPYMNSVTLSVRGAVPAALLAAAAAALAQAPINDDFAAATPLVAGVATAGTNVNATVQTGEPPTHWTATYAAGAATGRSVWFSYTPAESGLASFSFVGTGATAVAMQGAAYNGTALNNLVRIASASSTAGAAGAAGTAYPSNLFAVTAGARMFIQITGTVAAGVSPFDLTVSTFGRTGSVVLPRYSNWEWLHTTTGADPTASAPWASTWRIAGDLTDYAVAPPAVKFSTPQPAPLGFAAMDGAPGVKSDIGTAAGTSNNAAYARTTFTLTNDTSNLWAEIVADDGAYIYIDDHPGAPINIAARLSDGSFTTSTGFYDFRPQPDVFLTGAIPATATAAGAVPGCRAYLPPGFNAERNTKMVYLSGLVGQLSAGSHQIAVSVHQTGTASSDMTFDLQLIDMGAWPLAGGSAGIAFTDVPYVPSSTTTAVVPALEHHYAPVAGKTDLAWYCVAPDSSLAQGFVAADTIAGGQKALRWNAASGHRFVTEPVKVDGVAQFVASLRIRSYDTSSGFEDTDGFRVFLEASDDGITFSEPVPPLEVQPELLDDAAFTPFSAGFVPVSLTVAPNLHKFVRMVITGTVNSTSENLYFDDISFSLCQILATPANLTYNNNGDNVRENDTVSFELTVTGSGTAALTWTTTGFGAGSEVSGTIGGPPVLITRPAVDATGARQNVVFSIADDGNPACFANVTVTTPAAAIGTISLTSPVRFPGADPSSTADDTFSYSVLVNGTATGFDYEIRSSETGNATLYGTGIYGVPGTLTLPATVASLTIKDNSVPALLKVAALPPPGADLAMGRTVLNGTSGILYSNPAATAVFSKWTQASGTGITPPPADPGLTVTETTTLLHPAAALAADEGVLESPVVDITGLTNVVVSASLRAFETSTGSGFEASDTFKIEVLEDRGAGETAVNLITGYAADLAPANDLLNGFTGTTADPYDSGPRRDEFNADGAPAAGNSRGTFSFSYAVPANIIRLRVRVTGVNDSPNEYFFLQNLVITNDANIDSEPDGLTDAWEILYFGNLAQTGAGDADGDGQSNAAEQAAGTIPNDGTSVLTITLADRTGNLTNLTFNSVAGKKYIAQTTADLTVVNSWTDIGAEIAAAGTSTTIASLPDGGGTKHYFRVRLVP